MPSFGERLSHAWNAFRNNRDPTFSESWYGYSSYTRPDRTRFHYGVERSMINSIYNRIGNDCAAIMIQHVRLDENRRFVEVIDDELNKCFNVEANIDQTGRAFILDAVLSMLDEGVIAIVPTDTTVNPKVSDSFKINELRVGKIKQWFPEYIRVEVYNERTGKKEEVILPKKMCAIIENPFYSVMNEPNSTLKRLIHKMNMLDAIDEQSSSGKLDLVIQLPYVIKSEARRQQAENRRKEIEMQLAGSKYGIAYTDGTEKITQLNRSVENNLMKQIEYLTTLLYSQLGLTDEIMKGTADEATMLNYQNRTIEPIMSALTNEMERKFLTKTARSQRQAIKFFMDPFRLVPVQQPAEIADKFTRNEILSSNEVRGLVGFKPVDDPRADELRNKNLSQSNEELSQPPMSTGGIDTSEKQEEADVDNLLNTPLSIINGLKGRF